MTRLAAAALVLLLSTAAGADELLMARVEKPFPEAMNALQQAIQDHGYQVARVQRVDIGLTSSGFKTAEYRVVFFGKHDELLTLPDQHPELLAYLPLKFTIFAEGEHTLVATNNPALFAVFFRDAGLTVGCCAVCEKATPMTACRCLVRKSCLVHSARLPASAPYIIRVEADVVT